MLPGILIIVISSLILWAGMHNSRNCGRSKSWPFTKGKIVESGVIGGPTWTESETRHEYTASITYAYEIGGKTYNCSTIGFMQAHSNNHSLEKRFAGKYKEGDEVWVYYDPDNPKVACLKPGYSLGALIGLILPIPFLMWGIATFLSGL